jgi:uncharacterized OB-fold protein
MSAPVKRVVGMPVRLEYTVTAGRAYSRFLKQLSLGRVVGSRCPVCTKVYVANRGACPTCGVPTTEPVELPTTGTVTTFCVVNIPFGNMPFDPPYVAAAVLLDGADIPIFHLVRGLAAEQVRMGLRVRGIWVEKDKLSPTLESIKWFEPTGEPDAPYESYEEHL